MIKVRGMFLFTCCLLVAIGPLNIFQMIAWGNMIRQYSADRTITEATEMTFSGEYPCEMCRMIAEARSKASEEEKPSPFQSEERPALRLDLQCQDEAPKYELLWSLELSLTPGAQYFAHPLARFQRVPTPPPQFSSC